LPIQLGSLFDPNSAVHFDLNSVPCGRNELCVILLYGLYRIRQHLCDCLRLQRKLSQEKLAELAGLHATYVGRIERGRQNISLTNIGKIARALKVKPRELFKGVH